jgi:GxxExxY protein
MSEHQRVGLVHEELTGRILTAYYAVYGELGFGFLESVYEAALAIALESQDGKSNC